MLLLLIVIDQSVGGRAVGLYVLEIVMTKEIVHYIQVHNKQLKDFLLSL